MRILLDTHAFIWFAENSQKLSQYATILLEDNSNQALLSIASVWEMQIKISMGKLKLDLPLPELIDSQIKINNIQILPIELAHIWALEQLPYHQKDPFDRLIIGQSITENITILSIDTIFDAYSVKRVW
ncbi:type II toxin-antitoxin system VapC family toxin [Aphanizomenon sp. CS-733/32]|uniref:type II toxin-antitoxin system VapC family toxin n=1 Tax=Aphanizomenon sp. CS-733/32 TaxID=3021715 RepID=UPI00232A8645|nr:type II toxin-antitoxin system VapC family toxin [Aphanizomenon sp. CS-733/32]MDB9310971.1 type II toxin-antitoxin system VapC family toxin [Aphanizomenon sp. CS-733/32]